MNEKMPLIIFAMNDYDLIDQLPNSDDIESIKQISEHTYKVKLKETVDNPHPTH